MVRPGQRDRILLTQALESFRTTDYHFITPFIAPEGSTLQLNLRCDRVGTPPDQKPGPQVCNNALTYGGRLTEKVRR